MNLFFLEIIMPIYNLRYKFLRTNQFDDDLNPYMNFVTILLPIRYCIKYLQQILKVEFIKTVIYT